VQEYKGMELLICHIFKPNPTRTPTSLSQHYPKHFFWRRKTLSKSVELPQKTIPHLITEWKWAIYINFRESIVNTWFCHFIIKQAELNLLSKIVPWYFQETWLTICKPMYFIVSIEGRKWPAYVKFNAMGNLVGARFKTLVLVGFMMQLAWNYLEIWIKIKLNLSISWSLVLTITNIHSVNHLLLIKKTAILWNNGKI